MKNIKYLFLSAVLIGFTACNEDAYDYNPAPEPLPAFTAGSIDVSKHVAVGASFTAGYADGALFIAGQTNSFPKILNDQFLNANGSGTFTQPLMNDNIGGLLFGGAPLLDAEGNNIFPPRLYFNGTGPVRLTVPSTTEATNNVYSSQGPFNNMGVPGAKSFHITLNGYGALNPYFGRMASSSTVSMLGDAISQNPTFFTLSEVGVNDVLAYATSGGTGVDQTGNLNPVTYGSNDITDPNVFAQVFTGMVDALTANGAKGVVANVPYITNLPHFTTVPYNPLSPTLLGGETNITTLNAQLYGPLKNIFTAYGEPNRINLLSATTANPLLIFDETATDRSAEITGALTADLGAPTAAAFGAVFGRARQATAADLLVLPLSSNIGTTVAGVPAPINVNGVTYPLADKWVLIPSEQLAIKTATDAYNVIIATKAAEKGLALVDFKGILQEASTTGISDGNFIFTTKLVTGGLVSLDGIHLTSRGYAVLANKMLAAIDATYGSNFIAAGVKADPGNYLTNYPPTLQ
jgi:hypothetical protein